MTDNFEEFEQHNEESIEEPIAAAPAGIRGNITAAWRTQPLFKLFVLMVVVGAVVAVAVSLFSSPNVKSSAGLLKPPDLHEAPGGKSTPYLKEQTEMANKQRTEEAIQSGGSALPTPIGPGAADNDLTPAPPKEDPLNELRAEVENMNKQLQEAKQAQQAPPPPPPPPEPFDDTLAQAMQRQMSQLLDSWAPKGNRYVPVYDLDLLMRERQEEKDKEKGVGGAAGVAGGSSGTGATVDANGNPVAGAAAANVVHKTIVPAGTVSYAQLLTEANSDVPGPILAQIVSGPLKGARAIGEFKVNEGYDYLVLTFKLANLKGTDYKLNALALDPDTTLGGMATETDQRYLMRLVLPAAAGFLQGFSSALGQGNSSLTTNGTTTIIDQSTKSVRQAEYTGLSTAGQTASQFFQQQANQTKPLVRVAAGTPMGLFFVDTVTDEPVQNNQNQQNANNPNGFPGNGQPYNPYGNGYTSFAGNPYGSPYGGGSGYPVLYPQAQQGSGGYGGFGVTNSGYPGSTVYYTH